MAGQKVYLAVMSRNNPDVEMQLCMAKTFHELWKAQVPHKFRFVREPSLIQKTRNQFVADFLASDCTDLIMLDDDVAWEDGAVSRLLSHPCDVVGGIYPKREDPLQYPVRRIQGAPFDPETGLMEVELVPTGFLRMTRKCLEDMTQAYRHLAYRDYDVPGNVCTGLFWVDIEPDPDDASINTVWGEDFSFCRKWRAIGGKVHADILLRFKHFGQKAFEGCYAETLPVSELVKQAAE